MKLYNTSETKIGFSFPKNLVSLEESNLSSKSLSEIYQKLLELYENQALTLEDFKSFRNSIRILAVSEIEPYSQLILLFLSFPREKLKLYALEIDQHYFFSIFTERKKRTEIDPETGMRKELYYSIPRDFEMGDIITLSKSIYWKMRQTVEMQVFDYLKEYLEENALDLPEQQLSFYHSLLDKNSKLRIKWLEEIEQLFDQTFLFFSKSKEFYDYFSVQRESIDEYIKRGISKRIGEINKTLDREISNYSVAQEQVRIAHKVKKSGAGRKFGIWN